MNTASAWLVTAVIFQPLVFGALVWLLPQGEKRLVRSWTFLAMLINFALTVALYAAFDPAGREFSSSSAWRGSPIWASATTWGSTVWPSP
jgi:NADH:ubiquinone oxidoreductase subunit 4 (subunit M)